MKETAPRRRGRPSVGERVALGLRVTPEVKRQLDASAKQSGRSQSQEAEFRIEWSFDRNNLLSEVLSLTYGRQVAGILMMLGSAMNHAGATALFVAAGGPLLDDKTDLTNWIDHPDAFEQAKLGVAEVLEAICPQGDLSQAQSAIGAHVANDIIRTIRENSTGKVDKEGYKPVPLYAWTADNVRSLLGPAILDRLREPTS